MAQLTIYLPDEIEHKARRAAKAGRKSVSRWVAEQVSRNLDHTWPQAVLDAAGAAPDFPDVVKLRKEQGRDAPRERSK
jgi:hypothetical protein